MTKTACEECIQLRALVDILSTKSNRLEAENTVLQARVRVLESEVAWAENGYNHKFRESNQS